MTGLESVPPAVLWVAVTMVLYVMAQAVYRRIPFPLLIPVLATIGALVLLLRGTGTSYEDYMEGGQIIQFFLGPTVVALGLPLYRRLQELKRAAPALITAVLFGAAIGIVSATLPAIWLGAPDLVVRSLAPKSVTTPIAIAVAGRIGGDASLAAAFVVFTGILGAVIGPVLLRMVGITHPVAYGFALGCSSHGIGTVQALEAGRMQGAAAGLGICLCGIMTSILAPLLITLVL
jgi:predicted murein hydrolase (TIGR00659 family)